MQFLKIRPLSNGHEFEAHWTTVDKDLSKMEKYTLIHGLSMNFFFGFNDAQFVRKLVQAVRVFQTSPPGLTGCMEFQHPEGIEAMSPGSLRLALTTQPKVHNKFMLICWKNLCMTCHILQS